MLYWAIPEINEERNSSESVFAQLKLENQGASVSYIAGCLPLGDNSCFGTNHIYISNDDLHVLDTTCSTEENSKVMCQNVLL